MFLLDVVYATYKNWILKINRSQSLIIMYDNIIRFQYNH
ncbi:hypothetical protein NIES25_32450 [Nostoc linckia NIES-25]|nr:hypothetical protein NIES25_32450 [Nostoc linckia NIES-25]